ncbi:putative phospholipid ABC transporter-binding protein MlaD [Nocardioides aquaticus]|uniref:Phospholipid ABC transporter-binding protein MlaD n=1 Tax=Nocardioides aquaticus TaxID=160826 RepID=A0ABX8EP46_9ACTN|nr:MlaD family protein [Nocardioides aquaticus]QVT81650.1 putative phospholipid ABC transporter-binding protein MlaD [Nocardioides aquaticus]
MITRRTKMQLIVFAIITMVGVSFVGARYARLDRIFYDDTYTVVAHLAESGGTFAAGEVTYRGVGVGSVEKLELVEGGVDAYLSIEKDYDDIPADSLAVVGNRSAVGEQYVELQPQSDEKPYLTEDSEIAMGDTRTPVATETLLESVSTTVGSVNRKALRTTVLELGTAFAGTGPDLQRIIDSGSSFLETADANFDTTQRLLRDGNTVLRTQVDSESAIRSFSNDLELVSDTLVDADGDLRQIIDTGSGTALQLRGLIEDNRVELGQLLNRLVTTGEVVVKNLDGIEQLLILYPYVVEGGLTVVARSPDTGLMDAHFGLIITDQPVCNRGYEGTEKRSPDERADLPMNTDARCTESAAESNARGAQNIPRAPADYEEQVVASYDPATEQVDWDVDAAALEAGQPGSVAPRSLGKDSWKWLYLQPLASGRE